MARKSLTSLTEDKPSPPLTTPKIHLTLKQGAEGLLVVGISINEFIAYSQNSGFTRLNLTGGKVLEVKETTDQIDRLVRAASSQPDPASQAAFPAFNQTFNEVTNSGTENIPEMVEQPEFPGLQVPPATNYNSFLAEDLWGNYAVENFTCLYLNNIAMENDVAQLSSPAKEFLPLLENKLTRLYEQREQLCQEIDETSKMIDEIKVKLAGGELPLAIGETDVDESPAQFVEQESARFWSTSGFLANPKLAGQRSSPAQPKRLGALT